MADENFPLKPYEYQGYTISFRDGKWTAVKNGKIVYTHSDEGMVKKYASNHR